MCGLAHVFAEKQLRRRNALCTAGNKFKYINVKRNTPNKIHNGYTEIPSSSITEIRNLARVSNHRHFAAHYQLNKSGHILL